MDWRDIQGINNSLRETQRLEEETARLKAQQAEMERQAQLSKEDRLREIEERYARSAQYQNENGEQVSRNEFLGGPSEQERRNKLEKDLTDISVGLIEDKMDAGMAKDVAQNFSLQEQQAFGDLLGQGANVDDAYNAVKNGGSIEYNAGLTDVVGGATKQIGLATMKELSSLGATVGRVADSVFGKDTFKPFDGKLNDWFDEKSDFYNKAMAANRQRNLSHVVTYDKNTGKAEVKDMSSLPASLAFDIAGAVPLMVECSAGGAGVALASTAKTSDALHEYKLTEKEENDLWDLACAIGKGASMATTMVLGGKVGENIGKYINGNARAVFNKFVSKYGKDAATQFLTNRISAFLGSQAGGIASGEVMMAGDTALSDAIDNVFKGYDKDIWGDVKEAAKEGIKFHIGMQAIHGVKGFRPFKFRNEYKSWQEASNIYADNLKKNGFTYNGERSSISANGKDVIWTGEYKGRKCFITDLKDGKFKIKYKDRNNNDLYTEAEVDVDDVKRNPAGMKDVETFAGSELVRFAKPDVPVAIETPNGYVYKFLKKDGKGHTIEVGSKVSDRDDGYAFYVIENGEKKLRIYNDTEKAMQEPAEYDYFKKLNEQEEVAEPKAEDVAVEQPKAEEGINTPTDDVVTATAPTNGEIKVSDIDKNEFVEVDTENGDEIYTVIRYGNDDYIVPFKSVEESNASGDYTTKAYKIGEKGLEETNLTITEPNKDKVFSEESVSKIDGNALREQVGEELEAPKADDNSLKNDNKVKEQDEQTDGTSGDSTDNDSANSSEIPTNGTPAETLEQPQPKVEPTQPQPKAEDLPLVDRNFGVNMTKGANDSQIYVELVKTANAETANDFDILISAVESQMSDLKKAKQFGDALVLSKVIERLKLQKDTAKTLAQEKANAEKEAKKELADAIKNKKDEESAIEQSNREARIEIAKAKNKQKVIDATSKLEQVRQEGKPKQSEDTVNTIQQARKRGRPKKDKQAEQPQAEVIETPAEQTAPIVEQPIVETPSAETTTEQTTATHVWGDNMKPYLDKFSTSDTRRKLANLLSKVRQDETISLEDKEEFGNVVKEKQKSLSINADSTTQSTRTTNAQREEERVKHLTEVSNDLLNILQSETIENKKEELKNFIEKVNNDSKLSEEDKKQLINDAKRNIDILDGKEPTPPTDGGGKPADEVKTDAVEETAPVETPIDVTEATAPKDETTKTSTAKTELELAREEDNAYWAKQTEGSRNQGIVEKGKYDSFIAKINRQIANPKGDIISIDKAEKDEAYFNKYKEEGYKEKQLQLRNAIERLKKVLGKDSASKSEAVDEVDVSKELSDAQNIINTQTIDYKDIRTAQQKIDTLEASKSPFIGKKGYERVVKKYDDAIKELKGDAERERVAQEERTEKINTYKEENKSEDKESSTVRVVTIDKLKKEVPSEKSGAWKRLYADLKGATSVKAIQDADFKNFIEKFWNNYSDKLESALNKTLFDGNLQMYDKSLEVAKKIGLVDESKIKITENREKSEELKDNNKVATDERTKKSVENEAPKHILTEEQFDAIKKGLEKSGVFKHVKVVGDIIGRYEQICGKEAADAIRNSNGELLGFVTKNGDIFLSKKSLSADTLVHETGHCLFKAFRENGIMTQKAWEEMTMLAERCGVLDELPAVYKHLSKDAQVEEAFVRAIGKKGGIKLQGGLWERFKELAKRQWMVIKSYLGIENAKDELSFNDLADMYADKIVNGKYEAEEKKAIDSIVSDTKTALDEIDRLYKEDAEEVKLHYTNKGNGFDYDANTVYEKRLNHKMKFLNAKTLGRDGESVREWFSRIFFETFDPIYRANLVLHKWKGVFTGKTDIISRLAQQKSINMGKEQSLYRGEVKNLDNSWKSILKSGIKIKDAFTGEEKIVGQDDINRYLTAKDAFNGGNEDIYNEIIKSLRREMLGAKEEQIRKAAKQAMFNARQAKNAIKSMRTEIDKYELEVTKATTPEGRKKAEAKLENAYRRIIANKNFALKKAVANLNSIKEGIRHAKKVEFEKNFPGQTYTPTADLMPEPSLNLHKAGWKSYDLQKLRDLFVETESRVSKIVSEIEDKKINEKIDKLEKDFEDMIAEDKERMTATDWLHKVWIPKHGNRAPYWDAFKDELKKARENGDVQMYQTDGRGMSNETAKAYIDEFEKRIGKDKCENLTDAVKQINLFTLKEAFEGGNITPEQYDKMKLKTENNFYSPQRGFKYEPKKAEMDFGTVLMTDGSSVDTKLVQKAEGRIQEAADIFENLIVLAKSSIASSGKNAIATDYFDMLTDCKERRGLQKDFDGDLDSLVRLGKWYEYDEVEDKWIPAQNAPGADVECKNGVYEYNNKKYKWEGGDAKAIGADWQLNPKDAQSFVVNFNYHGQKAQMVWREQRVANAFNQMHKKLSMGNGVWDKIIKQRGKLNNFVSQCLTSYSLKFLANNHKRDFVLYQLKLAGSGYKDVQGSLFSSYSDIFNYIFKNKNGVNDIYIDIDNKGTKMKLSEILNEKGGLSTGYVEQGRQESVSELEKRINKIQERENRRYEKDDEGYYTTKEVESAIQRLCKSLENKTPEEAKKSLAKSIEVIGEIASTGKEATFGNISKLAEALELVPRLAAFKVAIKNGADFEQAVNFGKEITTNFNRNGDLKYTTFGKYLYASCPFLNAGFQGLKNAHDYGQTNTTRARNIMVGMFIFGLISNELERLFYGNDKAHRAKVLSIDDYNRGSSIRIPFSKNNYFQLEIPHGARSPLNAAMVFSDMLHGDRTWDQSVVGFMGSLGDFTHWDFSKLKEDYGFAKVATQFAPQEISLIADYCMNENFFGGKIYGESYDDSKDISPNWTKTIGNGTWGWLIDACKYLSETGSNNEKYKPQTFSIRDDGSIYPNRDDDMYYALDLNPQWVQYMITQTVPITQFADLAYRSYKKADKEEGSDANKYISAIKSLFSIDKVFVREFHDETISAYQLSKDTKKSLEAIHQLVTKDNWRPKTAQEREMFNIYRKVTDIQKQEKQVRKKLVIADQKGADNVAKDLERIHDALKLQEATELYKFYMLQIGDRQKGLKDWIERIEGYKE